MIETAAPPPVVPVMPAAPVPLVAGEAPVAKTAAVETPAIEAPPAGDATAVPPVPLDERTPPPPLFACKTWNREEYFSDAVTPAQRCAPMQTTGLGGDPAMGTGAACMVVSDACQPVADAMLCESWRDHLIRAEAIVEFKRAEDPVAATAELERVREIVRRSTCAR